MWEGAEGREDPAQICHLLLPLFSSLPHPRCYLNTCQVPLDVPVPRAPGDKACVDSSEVWPCLFFSWKSVASTGGGKEGRREERTEGRKGEKYDSILTWTTVDKQGKSKKRGRPLTGACPSCCHKARPPLRKSTSYVMWDVVMLRSPRGRWWGFSRVAVSNRVVTTYM